MYGNGSTYLVFFLIYCHVLATFSIKMKNTYFLNIYKIEIYFLTLHISSASASVFGNILLTVSGNVNDKQPPISNDRKNNPIGTIGDVYSA